jgi:hypothetical protein
VTEVKKRTSEKERKTIKVQLTVTILYKEPTRYNFGSIVY